MWTRRTLLCLAAALPALAFAQAPPESPLARLASWVGGDWVAQVDLPDGRKFKVVRRYEWGFEGRLLIGRSFGEVGGQRRQSRETIYFWNAAAQRVEFHDYLDKGGAHGTGRIDWRDGVLHMEADIVGAPATGGHPPWRATMQETPDQQVIHVEALADGRWSDYGRFTYRRER